METRSIAIGLVAIVAAFAAAFGMAKSGGSKTENAGAGVKAETIKVAAPPAVAGVEVGGTLPALQSERKPAKKKASKKASSGGSTASAPSTTKTASSDTSSSTTKATAPATQSPTTRAPATQQPAAKQPAKQPSSNTGSSAPISGSTEDG